MFLTPTFLPNQRQLDCSPTFSLDQHELRIWLRESSQWASNPNICFRGGPVQLRNCGPGISPRVSCLAVQCSDVLSTNSEPEMLFFLLLGVNELSLRAVQVQGLYRKSPCTQFIFPRKPFRWRLSITMHLRTLILASQLRIFGHPAL